MILLYIYFILLSKYSANQSLPGTMEVQERYRAFITHDGLTGIWLLHSVMVLYENVDSGKIFATCVPATP